jgi:hypothetical protein
MTCSLRRAGQRYSLMRSETGRKELEWLLEDRGQETPHLLEKK